jgi:hypothetical protein
MHRCDIALWLIQSRTARMLAFDSGSPHASAGLCKSWRSGTQSDAGHPVITVIVVSLSRNMPSA